MQIDISKEPQLQAALNARIAQELGAVLQDKLLLDLTADALFVENQQLKQHVAELAAAHEQREAELVAANTRIKEELSSLRQDFDSLRKRPAAAKKEG